MKGLQKTERVPIMFDPSLLQKLDDYSFQNRIRTRAEAVRRLVAKGIEQEETKNADAA
ncbi:ribbon-helix-helix domain-containing protein [Rhizobium sp. TRM95111]|uniref:ribbon-helix-helix domain-containing protein n=1 Tax=Rhizobium alarense TaxID=2846851 RepID=UPI001F22D325|nr:ribbon-helix-helix domain-containing protein [Rhizobium alarense]MCF3642998.1 ribbon-helix-helix domain-containing protein [Rhizobium alarense]